MGATIEEVAKRAQVSKAAVSFALNGREGVSAETRRRILRMARELNFTPRNRRSARTERIGFLKLQEHGKIVNRDHDVFIADYIAGMNVEAHRQCYELFICNAAGSFAEYRFPQEEPPAGWIVLGTEFEEKDLESARDLPFPVLFLDTWFEYQPYTFVTMNNHEAVHAVLSHFREWGHRRVGMVTGNVACANFRLREDGFARVSERLGLDAPPGDRFSVTSTYEAAYAEMSAILGRRKPRGLPTALFCANDVIAYGTMRALREQGYRIPADVSVIGFDDLPASRTVEPALTTYAVSQERIGELGMRNLIESLEDRSAPKPASKVLVSGKLVARSSVARPSFNHQTSLD